MSKEAQEMGFMNARIKMERSIDTAFRSEEMASLPFFSLIEEKQMQSKRETEF